MTRTGFVAAVIVGTAFTRIAARWPARSAFLEALPGALPIGTSLARLG